MNPKLFMEAKTITNIAAIHNYLQFVKFKNLTLWDVKRIVKNTLSANFPIVKLGDVLKEENTKYKIFEQPNNDFKILGVNNKVGLFDAYIEKGSNINQPYKKVEKGWLAYNPYRINVGSIGYKHDSITYDYISPAYIVFSCKPMLLPEYLYLLFKTETFSKVIRENTTGSVRQNLSYTTLANLQIPLPPIEVQRHLLEAYNTNTQLAFTQNDEAVLLDKSIDEYLNKIFGISKSESTIKVGLHIIRYTSLDNRWGTDFNLKTGAWIIKPQFKQYKISQLCKVSSGGTPNTSNQNYYNGNIPWVKTTEVVNEEIFDTETKITQLGLANSSAKMYPKGSLIIAMYGQGLTRGRTAKLGIDASTNQACAVLFNIDNELILTDFLWIYLMNEYERLRELASGNSQPNLNAGMILDYKIQVPPIELQQNIINEFNAKKAMIYSIKKQVEINITKAVTEFDKAIFR